MKKYLVLYHAPAEAMAIMANATEEQKMEGMKPWMAWQEKLGEKLVDMGSPLMPGLHMHSSGEEGSSSNDLTGFSIIQAANMEEAKDLIKGHPHLSWLPNCAINIHEWLPMG